MELVSGREHAARGRPIVSKHPGYKNQQLGTKCF